MKKNMYFDIQITKKTLNFIKIIQQLGLVRNYYLLGKYKCRIFIFYTRSHKKTRSLRSYLTKSHSLRFSNKSLKTLNLIAPTSLFLLETNKGLILHKEAVYKKVGGNLLVVVH
jgi:ribosomal protein S8